MEYRALGKTGLKVSSLCLGAMTFGEADESSMMHKVSADEKTSHQMLDRALELGINFIDTADVYGQDGLAERVIGNWFEKTGRRDDVVLATKFRFEMGEGPNASGASRYRIVKTVEDSLRRLKTDRIDLYQIHMQDLDTPEAETLRALDDLVRAGKVLYIGTSNYTAWRQVHAQWLSRSMGCSRYVTMQMRYNLVSREIEREHVSVCREFGMGVLPWSPLGGGFLTGKYTRDQAPAAGTRLAEKDMWWKRYDNEQNWKILDAVRAVASELDATPAQVAVAWLLRKPYVTSVIFGARTIAQLEDNAAAAELELPDAAFEQLEKASRFDIGYPYNFIRMVQKRW